MATKLTKGVLCQPILKAYSLDVVVFFPGLTCDEVVLNNTTQRFEKRNEGVAAIYLWTLAAWEESYLCNFDLPRKGCCFEAEVEL